MAAGRRKAPSGAGMKSGRGSGKGAAPPRPPPKKPPRTGAADPEPPPRAPPSSARRLSKKARLIVRNLSFKSTEAELLSLFSPFGSVLEVNVPKKPDGQLRGFAFIQFRTVPEAARALRALNMAEVQGRPVAVDWAVAKEKYQAMQRAGSKVEEAGNEEEEEEEKSAGGVTAAGGGEEEEEEEEEEEKGNKAASEDSGVEEESSDGEEEEEEEEEEGPPPPKKQRPSDVEEGRTVFIRNLSFETEEEALGSMLQRFGELCYVRLVLHPETEHSKGCAFAQFRSQEAAQECLRAAQGDGESGGLHLDGRLLRIDAAVSREEARKLRGRGTPKAGGTRNLYLAREGLIRAGTKAAEGVSESDMAKRARFEEQKRRRLQCPHVAVSRTRLCLHNLPKAADSAQLRRLLRAAAGPGARITECRVMRALHGRGPSLGFAFAEFSEHRHALAALRATNNNPRLFGASKRPIVEFSLEDLRKLRLKEQRLQRSRLKQQQQQQQKGTKEAPPPPPPQPPDPPQPPQQTTAASQAPPPSRSPPHTPSWAGFCTGGQRPDPPPGSTRSPRVLPLPSHRGPKVRKRDRGKVPPPPPPTRPKAKTSRRKGRPPPQPTPPRRQPRAEAHLAQLVERYRQRILGGGGPGKRPPPTSKWFQD